jgi:hypothetical protein
MKFVGKKNRAEREFAQRVYSILKEAFVFQAEDYVKDVLARAKFVLPPTSIEGTKLHQHWTTKMSLESLFDVPDSDKIEKQSGLASPEDWEETLKKRKNYYEGMERLKAKNM